MRYLHFTSATERPRLTKLVWSIVLPALLLLAFLSKQFVHLDFIGWSHGFNHPLEGWDHLITMLAVGIWAAQMRGHAIWMLPLAFVSVMSLGGLAGAAGISIPNFEGIILLSCAVFGVLITRNICFSSKINVLIVAFFAFFHGFAHGQEISTSASLISYTLGFMVATLLLHGAGIVFAKLIVIGVACLLGFIVNYASHASSVSFDSFGQTKTQSHTQHNKLIDAESWHSTLNEFKVNAPKVDHSTLTGFSELPKHQQHAFSERSAWSMLFDQTAKHASSTLNSIQTGYNNLIDALVITQFNQYFPDINNSPGTRLLSNGVGLTSPPTLNELAIASVVLSARPHFPVIQFEAVPLQFTFADASNGNEHPRISYPQPTGCALAVWRSIAPHTAVLFTTHYLRTSNLIFSTPESKDFQHSKTEFEHRSFSSTMDLISPLFVSSHLRNSHFSLAQSYNYYNNFNYLL